MTNQHLVYLEQSRTYTVKLISELPVFMLDNRNLEAYLVLEDLKNRSISLKNWGIDQDLFNQSNNLMLGYSLCLDEIMKLMRVEKNFIVAFLHMRQHLNQAHSECYGKVRDAINEA